MSPLPALIAAAIAFLLCVLFGSSRLFLNRSSHHALYSSRLTRAFLGASNPRRFTNVHDVDDDAHRPARDAATRVMQGDDLDAAEYWEWPRPKDGVQANGQLRAESDGPPDGTGSAYAKGAPLHLVNVTINETIDGRSRIQQDDRRGLILAIGPCGLSAGVQHHVVLSSAEGQVNTGSNPGSLDPKPLMLPAEGWRVFRQKRDTPATAFPEERLSLGEWLGVSGAAFSTGLGSRTNIGLSILAGLANIRLGYWWKPGVLRDFTIDWAGAIFWVQTYLLRELFSRFPGTANQLWYLSDGGHFENLGAYELIRRRVDAIIIVDAETDADYRFEGLANLVRKARIDFGADIEFLNEPSGPIHWNAYIGPLEHLRRGLWTQDSSNGPWRLESASHTGHSRTHAAIATVRYRDEPKEARPRWLLYVKPTLVGGERQDVQNYHAIHPMFPHESTADQFFGEDQWESYRKLGEQVGQRVFAGDAHKLFGRNELA